MLKEILEQYKFESIDEVIKSVGAWKVFISNKLKNLYVYPYKSESWHHEVKFIRYACSMMYSKREGSKANAGYVYEYILKDVMEQQKEDNEKSYVCQVDKLLEGL